LEAELRSVRDQPIPKLIAHSAAMEPVLRLIERVAPTDAAVLLLGENGTGKSLAARAVHAGSHRADRPMLTVDVASLSETVIESELFGHVKGAFTDARSDRIGRIELADGGTLFLDEIANVPLKLQAKLLRVVESGEYEPVGASKVRRADVRIVAATNSDLREEVVAGRFRQDLFFRLNTVEIRLPPLRERREDIPTLAGHFLRQYAMRHDRRLDGFDAAATQALLDHPWPGNVRELSHVIERAVLLSHGRLITVDDLSLSSAGRSDRRLEDLTLEEVERVLIEKALSRYEHNISQAAAALGLSRTALYRRLDKYGLGSNSPNDAESGA
jgi:DNA-binding NtrC family response regulator